jgi:hypothetical protein
MWTSQEMSIMQNTCGVSDTRLELAQQFILLTVDALLLFGAEVVISADKTLSRYVYWLAT